MDVAARAFEFDAESERASLNAALLAATADLVRETEVEQLLVRFSDLLVATSPRLRLAWFYIGDADAALVHPLYAAGPEKHYGEQLVIDKSRLMMHGPVRRALRERQPVLQRIPPVLGLSARLIPGITDWHRVAGAAGIGAVYAMPFSLPESDEWGLSVVCADHADYFDEVGEEPFLAFARLAQAGIDHATLKKKERQSREQLEHLSLYDSLTGLPNRLLFRDRVIQALSQQRADCMVTLALINLDDFKDINDNLSIAAGDEVLVEIGARLRGVLSADDALARLGADEFGVVFAGRRSEAASEQVFDRLFGELDRELMVEDRTLRVTASVGATIAHCADMTADDLMRQADLALQRAKLAGGNRWHFFEHSLESSLKARHELGAEIGDALANHEFRLYFQPQLRLGRTADEPVSEFEALIRWQHGGEGLLPPGRFIPAVEHTALIERIGEWALDAAMRQLSEWNARGLKLRVGVNIAARHLLASGFREYLVALLERYREVEPGQIEIEVTESAALADLDQANAVLMGCRELGVGVALDDFGTGHASLTYLQQLPATRVKIDKNFITELESRTANLAIVAGTVIGAGLLGLDVIAEGVETFEHGLMLAKVGCTGLQGYSIAKPMPADEVPDWIAGWQTPPDWNRWAERPFPPQALPLLTAQISHRRLTEQLIAEMSAPSGAAGLLTGRAARCIFDRWYHGVGRQQFWAYSAFLPIAEAHQEYHVAVDKFLTALSGRRRARLNEARAALRDRSDLLAERLEALQMIAMERR